MGIKVVADESVFVVTLSSRLSSIYNSAIFAKDMILDELNKKFVHVFDSLSTSVGKTLICLKIIAIIWKLLRKLINIYKEMKTFF